MARFQVEHPILAVQVTQVEQKTYAKIFVGEEPNRDAGERIASIMTYPVKEEFAAEVFAASADFKLGDMVRLHVETARGGKQMVRNEVFHIEPVNQGKTAPAPAPQANQPAKA